MATPGNNLNKKQALSSAYNALKGLQQELQEEEKIVEELRADIKQLHGVISQVDKDKHMLGDALRQQKEETNKLQQKINQLNLVINEKETSIENLKASLTECNNLTSIYNQTKEDLVRANSTVEGLKDKVKKVGEELELKKSLEENLNNRINLLVTEQDETNKKVHVLHEEYINLKSASAKRAAFDAQILSDKDCELNQLKETLENKLKDVSGKQSLIEELTRAGDSLTKKLEKEESNVENLTAELKTTQETLDSSILNAADLFSKNNELNQLVAIKDSELNTLKEKLEDALQEASNKQFLNEELTTERDSITTMLEKEANSVKNLMAELQTTQEAFKASRLDAADLSKQLDQSKRSNEELISKISRIQTDCEEEQKSLKCDLDAANWSLKLLSDELVSAKEALKKTEQELLAKTDELKDVMETLQNLKKNLSEVNEKAETTADDLKEGRTFIASLKKKLEEMMKHILEDRDARRKLEKDLKEAVKSLDDMDRKASLLSREIDCIISKNSSVEIENDMLPKSLAMEQKEAQVNIESAKDKLVADIYDEMENFGNNQGLKEDFKLSKGGVDIQVVFTICKHKTHESS